MRHPSSTPRMPGRRAYPGQHLARAAVRWIAARGPLLLRLSIGLDFLWFAIPKYAPGMSAEAPIAERTIGALTFQLVTGDLARLLLAVFETAIAFGLITGRLPRLTLAALVSHLVGTFAPLLLFPAETWQQLLVPTLQGQFILKNLIVIAAAVTLAGALRRGTAATGATTGTAPNAAVPPPGRPASERMAAR